MNLMKSMTTLAAVLCLAALTGFSAHAAAPDIEMVRVPEGCFPMGDNFGDGSDDEKPVHEVCVSGFSIGKYEVTQVQWMAVMGSNPSYFSGDRRPVDSVSWDDAQEFIKKLNAQSDRRYRLPTEAEWEYAARSGGKKEKWSGTSDPNQLGYYAWYYENSRETHVVGTKKPNGLGIHDMSGNVFEWCQDRYGEVWYAESDRDNPHGPMVGLPKYLTRGASDSDTPEGEMANSKRVMRGGSYYNNDGYARTANRTISPPGMTFFTYGFRLVLPAVQ